MNENHNFLAFDCGATSGRAILGTFSDGAFSMKEVWRFPNKPLCRDGRLYWDFDALREQVLECLRSLGGRGVKLESIGVDTWGVDFGCISKDASLCAPPRCYRDPYTSGIPEKVFGIVPREELYAATGIQIMDFNTIFQLYAQTAEDDAALRQASCILFMPDLISWALTGKAVCEYTD
ncbi:MAG: rhamnulokinase, partial [Bacteroidales bacterium]|nr:rhamnulokinase [Bacteroidales bacterium]